MPRTSDPVQILQVKAKNLRIQTQKLLKKYNEIKEKLRKDQENWQKVLDALAIFDPDNEELQETTVQDSLLRCDNAQLLGVSKETPGTDQKPVDSPSTPVQLPDTKGPKCPSCGSGSFFASIKKLSSGKQVKLMICEECSNEVY